jgi:hypothetical protein
MKIHRAEKMLDMATVAMYPRTTKSERGRLWRAWKRASERASHSLLSFNGIKVTREGLKKMLAGVKGFEGVDID